jgi:hypothetical protein
VTGRIARTTCLVDLSRGYNSALSPGAPMSNDLSVLPSTIEALADAAYPSFALLAGMELDLFTPLKDGPLDAVAVARAAGTNPAKTAQLLHALVAIGLMGFDGNPILQFSRSQQVPRSGQARLHRHEAPCLPPPLGIGVARRRYRTHRHTSPTHGLRRHVE